MKNSYLADGIRTETISVVRSREKNEQNNDTDNGTRMKKTDTDIPEEEGLVRYWKTISREETADEKMKRKDCGKIRRMEYFRPSIRIHTNVARR
jgi:hypothetical protein